MVLRLTFFQFCCFLTLEKVNIRFVEMQGSLKPNARQSVFFFSCQIRSSKFQTHCFVALQYITEIKTTTSNSYIFQRYDFVLNHIAFYSL